MNAPSSFNQDFETPLSFVWSEDFRNENVFLANLANPPGAAYIEAHIRLCNWTVSP